MESDFRKAYTNGEVFLMDGKGSTVTSNIRICQRCHIPYDWRRSASSSLKMTYCGSLCEQGDLGFTIEAWLHEAAIVHVKPDWRPVMTA